MPYGAPYDSPIGNTYGSPFSQPNIDAAIAIAYDLKATFTADNQTFSDAQVLDTAAEGVEAGSLTVVDTSTGTVKIVGNELEVVGSGVWDTTVAHGTTSIAKVLGKTVLGKLSASSPSFFNFGFLKSTAFFNGNEEGTFSSQAGSLKFRVNESNTITLGTVVNDTEYSTAIICGGYDSSGIPYKTGDTVGNFLYGALLFVKGGVYTNWTLLWSNKLNNTANLYAAVVNYNATLTVDDWFIPTLPLNPDIMFQPVFLDTFTGTNDDQLVSNHTPEVVGSATGTGNPWESGGTTWTIQGNAASNAPGLEASLWDADASVFTSGIYSWVAQGGNNVTNDANTLKIEYVDNGFGAKILLNNAADLSSDLTIGKIYRMSVDAKATGTVSLYLYDGVTADLPFDPYIAAGMTSYQFHLSAKSATTAYLQQIYMGAGELVWFDNLALQEITLNELFATDDLSITEGLFDVNLTIPSKENGMAGLVLAIDSESSPANFIQVYHNRVTKKVEVWKCVAGTYTSLINTAATYSAGAQLRAILDHDSTAGELKLKVYYNNALIGTEQTISDAGIVGNTRHGIMSVDSANTLENFTVHPRTNAAWDAEITAATGGTY